MSDGVGESVRFVGEDLEGKSWVELAGWRERKEV